MFVFWRSRNARSLKGNYKLQAGLMAKIWTVSCNAYWVFWHLIDLFLRFWYTPWCKIFHWYNDDTRYDGLKLDRAGIGPGGSSRLSPIFWKIFWSSTGEGACRRWHAYRLGQGRQFWPLKSVWTSQKTQVNEFNYCMFYLNDSGLFYGQRKQRLSIGSIPTSLCRCHEVINQVM